MTTSVTCTQMGAIIQAEDRYARLELLNMLRRTYASPDSPNLRHLVPAQFQILGHPYTSLMSDAGQVMLAHVLQQGQLKQDPSLQQRYAAASSLILEEGGLVRFDKQTGQNWLSDVTGLLPEEYTGEIGDAVLERRVMEYAMERATVITLQALRLPDGHLGLGHEELSDLAACLQAFKLGKEFGLDAVRLHIDQLKKGEILPGQAYVGAR